MSKGGTARPVVDVPALAGPTTLLRPWRAADAPVLAAAWRDPAIRDRLKVPEPADEAAASRWISQRGQAVAEGRSVDLAVTDRLSGEVIGEVGLSRLDAAAARRPGRLVDRRGLAGPRAGRRSRPAPAGLDPVGGAARCGDGRDRLRQPRVGGRGPSGWDAQGRSVPTRRRSGRRMQPCSSLPAPEPVRARRSSADWLTSVAPLRCHSRS